MFFSMARLRWRAPYLGSVPSCSRSALTRGVQLKTNWLFPVACRMRCCTRPSSISRIFSRCSLAQGFENHDLIDAVHELRRELAARRIDGGAVHLVVNLVVDLSAGLSKAHVAIEQFVHLSGAQVRGEDDEALGEIDAAVVAEGERGFIQNPEQELPQGVTGFLDLVKEQQRELEPVGVPLIQRLLGEQGVGFAVAEIAWGRADEFGDLMRVLKFGAVDLDDGARISEERLGDGFDDAGFARTSWPKKEEIANRTSRSVQARQKHLVDLGNFFDRIVLADDLAPNGIVEILRVAGAAGGVKSRIQSGFHRSDPVNFRRPPPESEDGS